MKKRIIMLIIALAFSSFKLNEGVKEITYNAYLSGLINIWEQGLRKAQDEYDATESDEDRFELVLVQYGILNATMKDKDEEIFEKYVEHAIDHLNALIEKEYRDAECKALLSAIYGLKISYSPWKGMFYGSKSSSLIEDAMEHYSDSPLVQKLYGNSKFFTPEMWGGGWTGPSS